MLPLSWLGPPMADSYADDARWFAGTIRLPEMMARYCTLLSRNVEPSRSRHAWHCAHAYARHVSAIATGWRAADAARGRYYAAGLRFRLASHDIRFRRHFGVMARPCRRAPASAHAARPTLMPLANTIQPERLGVGRRRFSMREMIEAEGIAVASFQRRRPASIRASLRVAPRLFRCRRFGVEVFAHVCCRQHGDDISGRPHSMSHFF